MLHPHRLSDSILDIALSKLNHKGLEAMMLSRRIFPAARLLVCLSLLCALLFGQSERGTISGTAKDATGAVVPGAKVVANETQTNVTINSTTNDAGDYTIPNVAIGIYSIRV